LLNEPPLPVRARFDEHALNDLAGDIRLNGLHTPLVVVPDVEPVVGEPEGANGDRSVIGAQPTGRYEIVAGHRRYIAAGMAGLAELPCMVHSDLGAAKEAIMVSENFYREEVTPAEEALLIAQIVQRDNPTEAALCARFRKSPEWINSRTALLGKDEVVFNSVLERKVNFSVAQQLNRITHERTRRYYLEICIKSGATAEVARSFVQQWKLDQVGQPQGGPSAPGIPGYVPPAENSLKCFLCAGEQDPQNLEMIYVHRWELDHARRFLGIAVEQGVAK